jgi:hypothetical protein
MTIQESDYLANGSSTQIRTRNPKVWLPVRVSYQLDALLPKISTKDLRWQIRLHPSNPSQAPLSACSSSEMAVYVSRRIRFLEGGTTLVANMTWSARGCAI